MAVRLPDNDKVDYFISAVDDHGLDGASLRTGQTVQVSSADPKTVVLVPDTTPRNAPDGSPSIASGVCSVANPVGAPNVPIVITSHISEADGTPGKDGQGNVIPDATDTITVVPGLVAKTGVLFDVPVAA